MNSSVDLITTATPDSFYYDPPGQLWLFDDRFLAALVDEFPESSDRRQAGRLLLLHEGVHLASHRLTGATAPQVTRFPNIVERLDYQADVWAFTHDYAICMSGNNPSEEEARTFFIKVVTVALNTFWAFDA